ncbi:hypothetical protein ACAG96_08565 [Candidatus Izemoplasma sp. B36]|uniref:DUF7670 domain-containing protein n=1 Tax=Candidatus Izemoplasma sp. B36 TaxID=3242468 RepID=UPI0035577299
MKETIKVFRIIIYIVGVFFLVMSFSVFDLDGSIWERVGGYLINSSPGIALILINYFLRKRHLLLGIILILAAIASIMFFDLYENIIDKIFVILFVPVPLFASGIIYIIYHTKYSDGQYD